MFCKRVFLRIAGVEVAHHLHPGSRLHREARTERVGHATTFAGLVPNDVVFEKMMSNIQEAKARGGTIIVVTTASTAKAFAEVLSPTDEVIVVPDTDPLLMPVLMVVPLQLLSYHIAVRRGCDVDQPRNLAKSVTVE